MPLGSEDAREAFRQAQLRHGPDDLVDSAPCGFLSTTPDGVIAGVNHTFLSWTGYSRAELVGRTRFADLLSPGGRIYYETHYQPMLSMQGTVREIALEVVRADRTRLPVLVNSVLDRGAGGVPVAVRTAVFDVTERRAYERELLRAKEAAEAAEHRATALAQTLQRTLIPPAPAEIPGLDVGAAYRPSGRGDEVGGDFYDVFQVSDHDWAVVIGDVSGKGVEAAVVTSAARYTVRGAAVRSPRPSEALAALNAVLVADHLDRYCTAAFVRLRAEEGRWTVETASGGHLPALHQSGDRVTPVGEIGTLLGAFEQPHLVDVTFRLEPAERLVLYTDGVTEARAGAEFYGESRLHEVLVRLQGWSASETAAGVVADVVSFQEHSPRDDIAVVVVQVPAPAAGA